jgi:hypothetical protein
MTNFNSKAEYEVTKLTIATQNAGNEQGRDNDAHDLIRALQSGVATEENSGPGIGYEPSGFIPSFYNNQ